MNCTDIAPQRWLRKSSTENPRAVFQTLDQAGVTRFYPGFRSWFFGKVAPGLEKGERCILTHHRGGRLVGVAICKRIDSERKLCTLWVDPMLRDRGIAGELAQRAFDWLGHDLPLFTVPEERLSEFSGLLQSLKFSTPIAHKGLYRKERTEYLFNLNPALIGLTKSSIPE